MKRSGPLPRRTPMPRGEVTLRRTTPLRAQVTPATRAGRSTLADSAKVVLVRATDEGGVLRCECCAQPITNGQLHIHHRLPRRAGGTRREDVNLPANLLALLASHHEWWEQHRADADERGLILRAQSVPTDVPVFRRGRWVYLDNTGGLRAAEGAA